MIRFRKLSVISACVAFTGQGRQIMSEFPLKNLRELRCITILSLKG
jgi:hypothetical protein